MRSARMILLAGLLAVLAHGAAASDEKSDPPVTITGFTDYPVQTYTETGIPAEELSKAEVENPEDRISVEGFYNRSKLILIGIENKRYYYVHRDDVRAADQEALHDYTRKKGRGLVCLSDRRQVAIAEPRNTEDPYTKGLKENPCN